MRSREGQGRVKGGSRERRGKVKTMSRQDLGCTKFTFQEVGEGPVFFKASGCTSSKELKSLDLPLLG